MKCENAVICPLLEPRFLKIRNFENLKIVKNRPKSRPALDGIFSKIAQNTKNILGKFFRIFTIFENFQKFRDHFSIFETQ